jgi:serine/threonine protein kinase
LLWVASWLAGPYVALIKEPFLGTLREVCNGRALPSALVSVLVRQVLEGLRYLHAHLLVQHNDITTNTAVLMPSGAVKLTSLGLCCAARDKMRPDDPELNPRRYHCDPTFAVRPSAPHASSRLALTPRPARGVLVVSRDES